jgi:hypothetical protein
MPKCFLNSLQKYKGSVKPTVIDTFFVECVLFASSSFAFSNLILVMYCLCDIPVFSLLKSRILNMKYLISFSLDFENKGIL